MFEPTETESRQTLDAFMDAMRKIADEAASQPGLLHHAPVKRLDEVKAARDLALCGMPIELAEHVAA